jgi:hypothetical protein
VRIGQRDWKIPGSAGGGDPLSGSSFGVFEVFEPRILGVHIGVVGAF